MTQPPGEGTLESRLDRRVFRIVFWGLAVIEGVVIAIWYRDMLATSPGGYAAAVVLVPVLVLGHGNVFPAVLAAWLWRRRATRAVR